jgi:hypothetical protein
MLRLVARRGQHGGGKRSDLLSALHADDFFSKMVTESLKMHPHHFEIVNAD